ncbi:MULTISPECIES: nuclear transport factor 2 family protein [unclassified Mesorhizobium]|jgi:ketosteroid isomerase-like protein|uniref:nuclear transport factor 2 family protein n=1 Tax=unclassified Mesorhizobium TaxID=325217 RepID=UPI000FE2BC8F|nr:MULTISPECIES: nuclear transport factor 2 family protein [unclassified Mesorhizobium]MDG4896374.1 nuclear transport factor 2 family protein [Mesorhizobium sp. WSM4976]RWH69772.1 MAG: nuclear transport factor 2 family protein [Mesorhizobium sp.]RWL28363.1 MAG: nuclear transport factor 2 family protein [Mesorhizobium sp.]RWL29789.1 MAG: nuclear transport factor 2 family protein [Mesorhizobium sp.]RWL38221.1 MAG: nuclear transport factor 2 family protein [Mesorhizobium sp.]
MRAVEIVSNLYKAYADRDIEGALSRCAEDVVFRWIADPRQSRHAGTAHGKQEFLSRLLALDDDFEYRHFVPVEIIDGGDKVAAQVEIHMTRRTTGEEFIMRTANFWTIRDGEIIEMVEYYDTALAASVF